MLHELGTIAENFDLEKKIFLEFMSESKDEATRIPLRDFQYAVTRGIASVPKFIAGNFISDLDSSSTEEDWNRLLDPLLENSSAI